MTRMKKILTAAIAATLMLAAAPAAQAAKPVYSCPAGFDGGPQTIEQILANPRSQAAIAAGVVSEAGIRAGFASVDKNGTGRICAKVSHGLATSNKPNGQYLLNIVDDNASVR
jgi:opacity protein-like surface antigen